MNAKIVGQVSMDDLQDRFAHDCDLKWQRERAEFRRRFKRIQNAGREAARDPGFHVRVRGLDKLRGK